MATAFTLSFGGSTVDDEAETSELYFSSNVPTVGVTGVTFNYKPTSTSKTITSISIPASGIDLANVFVPFLYENYNTFYGSLTIKRRAKPTTLILPYIPFNVSAPQGRPTITQLSINPPDISGIYNTTNLLGQPSSTNPDYSNLWLNCNNYNADLTGNPIGDIYALQFYIQSTDPSANLNDGVGIYTYYNNAKTFSGASYSVNAKTIYIPNNITSQIGASNQYITGDNIQDIIKTTAVSYDSSNNRTVISVSSALSTSSSNDNIIIASFLTGNNANIGISSVIDSSTGSTIPLVEDVYYSIYIEVSRFSSIDSVVSDIIDYSFFTHKINVPIITAVSNNGNDDTLQFTFNPPSDASSNGLHNIDTYILTYGASDSSANFVDTSNANVLSIVKMTSGVTSYTTWSDASGVSTTNTYVISNTTSNVWFQNIPVFKNRVFPIGTVFGLTASGLKKNNQVREYGFTGTYALTSAINMVVSPTILAVTVGKIVNNLTTPLSKTNFDGTGSFIGTYVPITVTGRIGTYGFNNATLTKSPVSIFLNDIQLDCFDLSSNDYDASGAYPTRQLVTFKVNAYVNYIRDFTTLNYGQGLKISSKLTDINSNNSSTAYLMTTSANGVYNSSSSITSNAYSYKIQDFPDDLSSNSIALANFYYSTKQNATDFNYVRLTWSITNTNSKDGLTTGSIQRITYNNANNGTNIQDVSSSLLSTIFAANTSSLISATLQTYTVDLNRTVNSNQTLFTGVSLTSNSITFPGLGPITNLTFVQNPSYTTQPTIRFQFGPPAVLGIDNTKFKIEITYGFSNTKVTFNPVSITPGGNNTYSVVTQSTNSSAEYYVPFTLGDNISVKVTPTDIYGQPGDSTTINLQGINGITNLQAAINNPFTEYPQITLTFQDGNGAYYIYFDDNTNDSFDRALTNNIVSNVVNGVNTIVLQSQNPTGSNYINFTWGDDLTINVYTKDANYNYLGKLASCPVLGIESVSNLTFIDNATIDLVNPYVSVSFSPPNDLTSGSIYYITATNITTSSVSKFTNAPYSSSGDGYRSLSLVGPDGSGNYSFFTQSSNSTSSNYFVFSWGHSIRIGVQPVNANNELGVNSNITLTGTTAVGSFAASVNDSLTDIPTVTLSFNNNGTSNAFYYATVTDEAYTTIVSNVVKSSVSGNTTKIILSNSSTNSFYNYVSTFNWGDPLTVNLYQKSSSYANYFGAIATTLIAGKNMVSGLTFAPNDSINNTSPYITVNFKRPDNFVTIYYYLIITNATTTNVYKYSNAPTNSQYNNLTLNGPDASGVFSFISQSTNNSGNNYLPFTFGQGLEVTVQAVDGSTNILSTPNTTTLNELAAVNELKFGINNLLSEKPQLTLNFTNGNSSYFVSAYNRTTNSTKFYTNPISSASNGVTTIILENDPELNFNDLSFNWGDDFDIKVYNKHPTYNNYLGAVSQVSLIEERLVSNLQFINNATYNTANPYATVQFTQSTNAPTEYYFITAQKTNVVGAPVYKYCNAPEYNNYPGLTLTGPDASGSFVFITQSSDLSNNNYFPFISGDTLKVTVQPVDISTNELGDMNSVTFTGTTAVTSFMVTSSPIPVPEGSAFQFDNNGVTNESYYAEITDENTPTFVIDNLKIYAVDGNISIFLIFDSNAISLYPDASLNGHPNYPIGNNNQYGGEGLTINLYRKTGLDKYLGAVSTTSINHKNQVSGLTFAPNESINETYPYLTVKFKAPNNFEANSFYIELFSDSNSDIYSNNTDVALFKATRSLTLIGPDASGVYTFITQSSDIDANNYFIYTHGESCEVSVYAIENETVLFNELTKTTLTGLAAVNNLKFGINNLLTEKPQLTLNFTNGNSSYFVSAYNRTTNSTKFYTNPISSASNGVTTIILENDPELNFNDLSFNWGDDFDIKVYNKHPTYNNYLGAVSQVSLIEERLVSNLQFINNATYNTANPYATVQFTQSTNAPTEYYFITAQKTNVVGAPVYKYCNAPEYNNYPGLTLTGPDASGSFVFITQSSDLSNNNYFPFTSGDTLKITVQPVDISTNELGDMNSVTYTGTTAVTSFNVGINDSLTDTPEVTFTFDNNGNNSSYYAEITDESSTVVIENVVKYNVTNNIATFIVSQLQNASYNYVPNFNWGDPLTIKLYQRDANLSRYLGAVATTSITGKNMVTGLTFAPNDSINNTSPYITVNFKRPDNLSTDSYFITITNTTTTTVKKYSNAPNYSDYDNLTLTGPDASGVYTFVSQTENDASNNYLPLTFGQGLEVIVQGVEETTNILSATNTITLNELETVTGLTFGINNLLTEKPQLTLNFTNGNNSYFVSAYNRTSDSTKFYTNPISSASNGVTTIIIENDPELNFNDLSFNWGDDFDIKVYNKYPTYNYLGAVSQVSLIEERLVSGLQFINNADYNTANPYATVQFIQPNNAPTEYYFITAQKTNVVGATVYKYCNAPEYNNYPGLTLTGPDASGSFVFITQSSDLSNNNYFPFTSGDTLKITVQPVDISTNELGDMNSVTYTGTTAVTSFNVGINDSLTDTPEVTFTFDNNGNNSSYYAEITDESSTVVIENVVKYNVTNNIATFIVSQLQNASYNYVPNFNWGDPLTIKLYQRDANLSRYLGAVATTSITGKNMVTGLTFAPNDSINNTSPYITVNFKRPDNLSTDSYFITITNTTTTTVKKYSNAPNYSDYDNLTLTGPDASGVYTFISQSTNTSDDNHLPFTFGEGIEVIVQGVEETTNILSATNTITLNSLASVTGLKFGINNLLNKNPQLTLNFTNGNGSYFVSAYNRTTNSTKFYTNPLFSSSNGVTTIILENDPTLNFNDLLFNWEDDFDIKVYNKYPAYNYLGGVSQVSLIEERLVSELKFINNADYNRANPYATVQFKQPDNAPTEYYFITAQKTNVVGATVYKYCNAPEYNNYPGLTLTGPDEFGDFVFITQSSDLSNNNYFPFISGDSFTITVQPVDISTNQLGDMNSVTFQGVAAVTSFNVGINSSSNSENYSAALISNPEVTFTFNNNGKRNEGYYAEITDESSTIVIENVRISDTVNNIHKFVISQIETSEYNYVPNFNWGDPLTVQIYEKKNNGLFRYLGAVATTTITGKNMVSELTFAPNDSINNNSPYITTKFKRPNNLVTDLYVITIKNTTTNSVVKYSNYLDYTDPNYDPDNPEFNGYDADDDANADKNAPFPRGPRILPSDYNPLTLNGPDASGIYTFISQSTGASLNNYLPLVFGEGLEVSVQAIEPSTNILTAKNTITLDSLSAVSNLNMIINSPLTDIPEITLSFTGGNGSYFIKVTDLSSNLTQIYTNPISSTTNGITMVILESDPSLNYNDISFNWGADLNIKVYNKNLNYYYLGSLAQKDIIGSRRVSDLSFVRNTTYNLDNPFFTLQFNTHNTINTSYFFITVHSSLNSSTIYKFSNATNYNNYRTLSLNGPDEDNNDNYTFRSQSVDSNAANYFPFNWGENIYVSVRTVDNNTNNLGDVNMISYTGVGGLISFSETSNLSPFRDSPTTTLLFNNNDGNFYDYYLLITNHSNNDAKTAIDNPQYSKVNNGFILSLFSDPTEYNNVSFNWGDSLTFRLYKKDTVYLRYLSDYKEANTSSGSGVSALTFIQNSTLDRTVPYISVQFQPPTNAVVNTYSIKITSSKFSNINYCNNGNYAGYDNLTLTGPDANNKITFITQQSNESDKNYLPFNWGDDITITVTYINENLALSQSVTANMAEISAVRQLAINSNADMYYDSNKQFHPYITFSFLTPTTGSPTGNNYLAVATVNNSTTPQTFVVNGNSAVTQSINPLGNNYLDFEYGDKIELLVYPLNGTSNRLGKISSMVTVNPLSSVRNLQFIENSDINNNSPYISLKFRPPVDISGNYYNITVNNNTTNEFKMFRNLSGFGNDPNEQGQLTLVGPDVSGYFTFISQSTNPMQNNYLNFIWGDSLKIFVTGLDSNGDPGAFDEAGLTIPAYSEPNCGWLQNTDISLNPYLTVLLDINGVDANAPGTVNSYYMVFVVNDVTITNMIANISTGSITNGSITDNSIYVQAIPGTTTQYKLKTQSTSQIKSNYLPFNWNDKVVLTVYPITTGTNRLGRKSDSTTTTHNGSTPMTINAIENATYEISAPYITLNATYYSKYFVSIVDSSNTMWNFVYDSSGNANQQLTVTTIITNNSIVPLTSRMSNLNITAFNLNVTTNQLFNQQTIAYEGIGSVTPTIIANATVNPMYGYLTVQFSVPTFGTVSTRAPYVIAITELNSQTKTIYQSTVYDDYQTISDLSNNGLTIFKESAVINNSNRTFTTQSYDNTKPNYLPFIWGDNYNIAVYPSNQYNYLGLYTTTNIIGMPALTLTLVDTRKLTNPTVKVRVTGTTNYSNLTSNIYVNENSINTVGPLFLTNPAVDSSGVITIPTGTSCINYPSRSIDAYGKTSDISGSITSATFIRNDEVTIDVRLKNTLNHVSATTLRPIAIPYRAAGMGVASITTVGGNKVVNRNINFNGQAIEQISFVDSFTDINGEPVQLRWLLSFTIQTEYYSHKYNNSEPSSLNASIYIETIGVMDEEGEVTYTDATSLDYQSVLDSLCINNISITSVPYTTNNRAITSARFIVTYNSTNTLNYTFGSSTPSIVMSGQNNFGST